MTNVLKEACHEIRASILKSKDPDQIADDIFHFSRNCALDDEVEQVCRQQFGPAAVPGTAAACLKALEIHSRLEETDLREILKFATYDKYEDWYDEIHFMIGYVADRKQHYQILNDSISRVLSDAEVAGDIDLTSFAAKRGIQWL